MKKLIFFILGFVCAAAIAQAQSPSKIRPLHIGDTVPDILFQQVMNYPAKTAKLSDFDNKKLLILDFWSTGCSSCIELLPKIQNLANKFKKDLQIILVNSRTSIWHDNEDKIFNIENKIKSSTGITIGLPIVLNNTLLDSLFPYQTLPQEVWIGEDGKVIAITDEEELTNSNVKSIINGQNPVLRQKNDIQLNLKNHTLSEIVYKSNLSGTGILSSSLLYKGYVDGLPSRIGFRRADTSHRDLFTGWYMTNSSLLSLFQTVFFGKTKYLSNRIILDTKDSDIFRDPHPTDTSFYSRSYSYEIKAAPSSYATLLINAQIDLENTFHVTVAEKKKDLECYVINNVTNYNKLISKGGKYGYVMDTLNRIHYVNNFPMQDLIYELNLHFFKIPIIDKTGFSKNVDIKFPRNLSQKCIIETLKKYGLDIRKESQDLDVMVIMDK